MNCKGSPQKSQRQDLPDGKLIGSNQAWVPPALLGNNCRSRDHEFLFFSTKPNATGFLETSSASPPASRSRLSSPSQRNPSTTGRERIVRCCNRRKR
nr:hypothetical protein Iba_chr06fCG9490 [Ipomoea batatas]